VLFLAHAAVEVLFVVLGGQTVFHVAFADALATGQNDGLRVYVLTARTQNEQ